MTNQYQANIDKDRAYFEKYTPEIQTILAPYFITKPLMSADYHENADLMTTPATIAVRTRGAKHFPASRHVFTLRSWRESGHETELSKILQGWGSHIFYSFENNAGEHLIAWLLGDLNVFRAWYRNAKTVPPNIMNKDKKSAYKEFKIEDIPKYFVVASKNIFL